ncbi:MAG: alkaline phosphatase family protein [Planctomycetota bacterium]
MPEPTAPDSPKKNRVLLIGWDAADWRTIQPMMDRGGMPNLKKIVDEGVWGNLETMEPVLSPILWTSIATGKRADKHDILGFLEPDNSGFVRTVSSTSRKAKAIWNIASQEGLRSAVVGWYASHPAEPVRGCIVTDRYEQLVDQRDTFANDKHAFHPHRLKDDLAELHLDRNDISADQIRGFIPEVDEIDTDKEEYPGILAHTLAQCASVHNAATLLLEDEEWDLAAVYYTAIDHFGHSFGEFHPPQMDHVTDRQFRLYSRVMSSVYQYHDLMLGRLMELAGDDVNVIVMSDHGFKLGDDRPKINVDPQTGKRTGPGMNPVLWHHKYGIFAAKGPSFAKVRQVQGAGLLDIAPTVLQLLGLRVPRDMDGHVIQPAFAEQPEIEPIATYEPEHPDDGVWRGEEVEPDPFAAEEALRQLEGLGYLEAAGEDKTKAVNRVIRDRQVSLATVHYHNGRHKPAAAILRTLLAEEDKPDIRYQLCNCLAAMGQREEAAQLIEEATYGPGFRPMFDLLRAQLLLERGDEERGLAEFRRLRDEAPQMRRVRNLMARPLIRLRRFEEAEPILLESLELNPEDAEAYDLLGVVQRGLGRHEDAVESFMKAVTFEKERVSAHVNLGVTLVKLKQWDWAIRAFEIAVELRPGNTMAHRQLARLYKRVKNDYVKAAEHASAARFGRQRRAHVTVGDDESATPAFDHSQW